MADKKPKFKKSKHKKSTYFDAIEKMVESKFDRVSKDKFTLQTHVEIGDGDSVVAFAIKAYKKGSPGQVIWEKRHADFTRLITDANLAELLILSGAMKDKDKDKD